MKSYYVFGQVLEALKSGKTDENKFARKGWNGKNMFIAIQKPDEHSKMQNDYIYMKTADGSLIPWLASQSDLLSDDWEKIN